MNSKELNGEYFDWMYNLVCGDKRFKKLSYRKLLNYLHSVEFTYILEMDSNRAVDGLNNRYTFGDNQNYRNDIIDRYLNTRHNPCSVLEMLVALAIRCESHIMDDPDIGNRTGQWFWVMLDNLGVGPMHDDSFNVGHAEYIISRFLNREYKCTGEGGLFTVNSGRQDLRYVEIWYQMCWYLNSIL